MILIKPRFYKESWPGRFNSYFDQKWRFYPKLASWSHKCVNRDLNPDLQHLASQIYVVHLEAIHNIT